MFSGNNYILRACCERGHSSEVPQTNNKLQVFIHAERLGRHITLRTRAKKSRAKHYSSYDGQENSSLTDIMWIYQDIPIPRTGRSNGRDIDTLKRDFNTFYQV